MSNKENRTKLSVLPTDSNSNYFGGYTGQNWSTENLKPAAGNTEIDPHVLLVLLNILFPYERFRNVDQFSGLDGREKSKLFRKTLKMDIRLTIYATILPVIINLYKKLTQEGYEINYEALSIGMLGGIAILRVIAPYIGDYFDQLYQAVNNRVGDYMRRPRHPYDYSTISYGSHQTGDENNYPTHP